MAFTEKQEYKLEVLPNKTIQCRRSDIVEKDGVFVGQTYHRSAYVPGSDVSAAPKDVTDISTVIWTADVITAYQDSIKETKVLAVDDGSPD